MTDVILHLNIPSDFHLTLSIPEFTAVRDKLEEIRACLVILIQIGERMSEAADQLTAAVQTAQTQFAMLNTTLQTEMQEIVAALSAASSDQALRDATADAVARLGTLANNIGEMNTTIQGIIP